MTLVTISEVKKQIGHLIQAVQGGEEVVITQNSQPVAKLVAIAPTAEKPKRGRVFGSGKGIFRMAPDFDAPLEDFKEYME